MKKIMYLNPLGIPDYDQSFADMALQYKDIDTEVTVASLAPNFGSMNHLEYRAYEELVASDTIKAVRQASIDGYDALVIGCFYDPGLRDAREIAGDMVVVAPCQSCCEIALRLANNFSVIIGRWKWFDQMSETINSYGYGKHLASFREVGLTPPEFITDPEAGQKIIDASLAAVKEDKAESIILGCTLESGFYQDVQNAILADTGKFVPVIDASIGALKIAENAAFMKNKSLWKTSKAWGMEPPSESEMANFGIFREPYVFGNMIVVS